MKVLFYTSYEVSPQVGGTERITSSVSNGLRKYKGYKCYSAFRKKNEYGFENTKFDGIIQLDDKNFVKMLRQYIIDNNIDVIVNQGDFHLVPMMRQALDGLHNKYLIFAHHFNPGAESYLWRRSYILLYDLPKHPFNIKLWIKYLFFPYFKKKKSIKLQKNYKTAYEGADNVVLLSDNFRPEFMAYAGITDDKKFRTIHNSLSYDVFFDMTQYAKKEKEVLIVSRLDEVQKRISLALKIWEFIEQDEQLAEWRLTIVGYEVEKPKYQQYVSEHGLSRVTFTGMQEPSQYYNRASIFMMTSLFEGWGLTLTEAQQYGCVPLAFNSYASLPDIITDGVNGYIITECDLQEYAMKLKKLMADDNLRKTMASRCVELSHRFENIKITDDWDKLISNINKNNKNNEKI